MKKKTLILSQEQVNRILESNGIYAPATPGNSSGLDDFSNNGATEVVNTDQTETGLGEPKTTDDIARQRVSDPHRFFRYGGAACGMAGVAIREEDEHGNARLNNRVFGASSDSTGDTYNNTEVKKTRYNQAIEQSRSEDPSVRAKGQATVANMRANTPKIDQQLTQLSAAKTADALVQQNKVNNGQRVHEYSTRSNFPTKKGQEPIITYEN